LGFQIDCVHRISIASRRSHRATRSVGILTPDNAKPFPARTRQQRMRQTPRSTPGKAGYFRSKRERNMLHTGDTPITETTMYSLGAYFLEIFPESIPGDGWTGVARFSRQSATLR
jgi:hypothetical protein